MCESYKQRNMIRKYERGLSCLDNGCGKKCDNEFRNSKESGGLRYVWKNQNAILTKVQWMPIMCEKWL